MKKRPRDTPEPRDIEFCTEEWGMVEFPDIGMARGMANCVGVIIYDPVLKRAMIGHFASPAFSSTLGEMLSDLAQYFPELNRVKVYLGGGGSDLAHEIYPKDAMRERAAAITQLSGVGLEGSQMHSQFNDGWYTTNMTIDTASGRVSYEMEENFDDTEGCEEEDYEYDY